MPNGWLPIKELVKISDVSEITIRRYINKYKSDKDKIIKEGNLYLICLLEFSKKYVINHDKSFSGLGENDSESKKQAMQIAYNSQALKLKDETIRELINKKTPISRHSTFWVTFGFCVLITLLLFGGYFYKQELRKQHQMEIQLSKSSLEKEISFLNTQNTNLNKTVSSVRKNSKMLSGSLKMQNKELLEQNKALQGELSKTQYDYRMVLGNTGDLHVKYGAKLEQLEIEIQNLRKKLGKN